jgi:hypothetical protein
MRTARRVIHHGKNRSPQAVAELRARAEEGMRVVIGKKMIENSNSVNRRLFLWTSIVGSVSLVLKGLDNPSVAVAGQSSCFSRVRGWDPSRLSNAVIDHVTTELGRVYNTLSSTGSIRAEDVRATASNIRLLFAHFDEIQLTPALEQMMRGCRQEILNFVPREDQLRRISKDLSAFGVSLPPTRIREMLSLSPARKVRVISELEGVGIQGFANRLIKSLNRWADSMEQQNSWVKARYVRVLQEDAAEFICDALVFLALLWQIGCELLGCTACCAAALALLLFAAFLDLVGFCDV